MPENQFGNWNGDIIPIIAGWILLVATFIVAIGLIALFARKVMGPDGGHTDD